MNINVLINGKEHSVGPSLTYEQIVTLADTEWGTAILHSVTYHHIVRFEQLPGERDGLLSPGQSVPTSPGMHINAVVTGSA